MPSGTTSDLLDALRDHLAPELAAVETTLATILSNRRTPLTDEVGEHLRRSAGKRIRPVLTLLTARGLGADGRAAAPVATAMECVHIASLLHDDVIDQAPMRRGAETINRRYGSDVAILMGNYLYSHAFQLLLDSTDPRPLQILTCATARMCEGEMFQIEKARGLIGREDYLRIITDKTAHLISACTALGAVVADGDDAAVDKMTAYGLELGMAYQIVDDALDYAGADDRWGKAPGTDLREGKWTLPLIRTFEVASPDDRRALLDIWDNGREFPAILEILDRYDGIEQCFALARDHAGRAAAHLQTLPRSAESEFMHSLPNFVVTRTH
jgi:octaprenyl-diphosphate synthase